MKEYAIQSQKALDSNCISVIGPKQPEDHIPISSAVSVLKRGWVNNELEARLVA